MDDLISRQALLEKKIRIPIAMIVTEDKIIYRDVVFVKDIEALPSADPDVAEKLHRFKCCITDKRGFQHEVIYVDDIRRVMGWEI